MENNNNICTVLVISYNHEKYITRALDSILAQKTKYGYSIKIFDDASKDNTKDIIKKYPKDATAYISLSTMLLIDMKDVKASVEVYKDASVLPDIESNSNFVSLKNKLQNIGGI